jgi:hypothetical protein
VINAPIWTEMLAAAARDALLMSTTCTHCSLPRSPLSLLLWLPCTGRVPVTSDNRALGACSTQTVCCSSHVLVPHQQSAPQKPRQPSMHPYPLYNPACTIHLQEGGEKQLCTASSCPRASETKNKHMATDGDWLGLGRGCSQQILYTYGLGRHHAYWVHRLSCTKTPPPNPFSEL